MAAVSIKRSIGFRYLNSLPILPPILQSLCSAVVMQTPNTFGAQSSRPVLACLARVTGTQCVYGVAVCLCMEGEEPEGHSKTSGDTI